MDCLSGGRAQGRGGRHTSRERAQLRRTQSHRPSMGQEPRHGAVLRSHSLPRTGSRRAQTDGTGVGWLPLGPDREPCALSWSLLSVPGTPSLRERDRMASAARAQAKFLRSWPEAEAMLSYLWWGVRGLGTRPWARRPYFRGKGKANPSGPLEEALLG